MLEACPLCEARPVTRLPLGSRQAEPALAMGECGACTHRFILEPPSDDHLKSLYDTFFKTDHRQEHRVAPTPRDRALAFNLKGRLPARARLLDIGANFGETLLAFPRGYALEGVELSASAAQAASRNPRLTIHNDFFENLDLPAGAYDGVLSLALIEHLLDPMAFLGRIARLLKPGGVLVLMTGDYGSWEARRLGEDWSLYHAGGHLHFFNARSLTAALDRSGFRVEDAVWAGPGPLTSRLPPALGRLLHCQTATLLFPFLLGRRKYGDLMYVWCRRNGT